MRITHQTVWVPVISGVACANHAPAVSVQGATEENPDRPNIVIFFTDDQGYADLGIHGLCDQVQTPQIDRLARQGVLFTSGYVTSPVCAPSRAGLMTGQYQTRFGLYSNNDLPLRYSGIPLPERLRRVGYRTGMIGKLHLPLEGRGGQHPRQWGFDEFFMDHGMFVNHPHRRLVTHSLDGEVYPQGEWMEVEGYRTDLHTEAAVQFIQRNHKHPFLLYVAYFSPHTPLEATGEYLDRFPGVEPEARRYALAMIAAMDDGVGRIVDQLEKKGLTGSTLVFFMSDNGAPLRCPDPNVPISQLRLNEWNGSINEPAAGEKGMLAEGGIRVPFLACWPGRIPAGQVVDKPVITLDVAPTVLGLAGASLDDLDGVDLMPVMAGDSERTGREALFWAHGGQDAIRMGNWKYIETRTHGAFLFNLEEGVAEDENKVHKFPEITNDLRVRLNRWLDEMPSRDEPVRDLQLQLERRMYETHFPGSM